MRLTCNQGVYVLRDVSYNDRAIPREAGFTWDASNKIWWTLDENAAISLARCADNNLREQLEVPPRDVPAVSHPVERQRRCPKWHVLNDGALALLYPREEQ